MSLIKKSFTSRSVKPTSVKAIGFSPTAKALSAGVKSKLFRDGVHLCRNTEMASLHDVLRITGEKWQATFGKKTGPQFNGQLSLKAFHGIIKDAITTHLRVVKTAQHQLPTDAGDVFIAKKSDYETFFLAVEDFPKWVDLISAYHPRLASKLNLGWLELTKPKVRTTPAQFFNF